VSDAGAGRGRVASLSAPWPNPSRGAVSLTLGLPASGAVTVAVYDVLGRRVLVAHEGVLGAGEHALSVDVSSLAPGAYVVRASGQGASGTGGGGFAVARRITVVR